MSITPLELAPLELSELPLKLFPACLRVYSRIEMGYIARGPRTMKIPLIGGAVTRKDISDVAICTKSFAFPLGP
jgi:hypothetical protein